MEFEVGEQVKCIDRRHSYRYQNIANNLNLKNFNINSHCPKEGEIYTIIAKEWREDAIPKRFLYGISDNQGNQYIVNNEALEAYVNNPSQINQAKEVNWDNYPDICELCGKPAWNDKFLNRTKECSNNNCQNYKG